MERRIGGRSKGSRKETQNTGREGERSDKEGNTQGSPPLQSGHKMYISATGKLLIAHRTFI